MLLRARAIAKAIVFSVCASAQEQALREAARLDAEGKCEQSEPFYSQALAKGPASPALLNNAGNHYLVCGQPEKARISFESLLKIAPAHQNANLQLARIATERKQGVQALAYLSKVRDSGPGVSLIRAEALHCAGRSAAAVSLLETVQREARNDPRVLFTLGLTAARIGLFDRAEAAFSAVAAQMPGEFDVLFNLGRAAARAGHHDRAVSVLEVAANLRPQDAGALLELGRAYAERHDYSRAVYVLARARENAPKNPEVLLALARAAEDAGYQGDAALAYDEYLTLKPDDDRTRLDRARVRGLSGTRREEGLKETEWYIRKHPEDPMGHFALAQLTWEQRPEAALNELSQALRLKEGLAPAHFARAWLLQRLGRMQESLPDLEAASRLAPDSVRALDQLGLTYLSLDRLADAEKSLRAALSLSPDDREVLMHMGQVLMALDREAEAQQYFERFRKLPPRQVRDPRTEAGMIELATLPASERARRQIERLQKQASEHPSQPELQLRLAQLLLAEGRWPEAQTAYRELSSRNADSRTWEEAGGSLVRAGRYELAVEFLRRAVPGRPSAYTDLAIALYFTAGPKDALDALQQAPDSARGGDYLLLLARLLDASGRNPEAEKALQAGLQSSIPRPQVAMQASLLLLRRDRPGEALSLLEQAIKAAPADAELPLMRAVALGLIGKLEPSENAFREIHSRWPEWDRPYLAHGLLLEGASRATGAKRNFQTALALNPQELGARCGMARLAGAAAPEPGCSCIAELRQILFPACGGE